MGFWARLGVANIKTVLLSTYGLSSMRPSSEVSTEYLKPKKDSCNLTEMVGQVCSVVISGFCEVSHVALSTSLWAS